MALFFFYSIEQVNQALHVYIRGPFGAPTSRVFQVFLKIQILFLAHCHPHTATLPHCHCHPQAQHAVLIGTGIGVTPYASILQSIMHRWDRTLLIVNIFSRYWAARNTCPKCSYRWTNDLSSQVLVMMMMLLGINIKSISIPNKVKKSNRYHLNRVSHFLPVAFFSNCLSKLININIL